MKKTILMISALAMACVSIGCGGGSQPPSDPNRGFDILGQAQVFNVSQQTYLLYPSGGRFQGQFLSGAGTYGSITSFDRDQSFANYNATGAKVPGTWRISLSRGIFGNSLCFGSVTKDVSVNLGSMERLICPGGSVAFVVQPDTIDALNPPATISITGSGIEDTYGEPMVVFYDEFGNVAASAPASQKFAEDGSLHSGPGIASITVNTADLTQVYDGIYSMAINNVNADGSWTIIGGAAIAIYGNPPPPPPDPDPGDGGCTTQPPDQEQLPCESPVIY